MEEEEEEQCYSGVGDTEGTVAVALPVDRLVWFVVDCSVFDEAAISYLGRLQSCSVYVDSMFHLNPCGQCHAKDKVKEPFVGDRKNYKSRREGKEKNHQTMYIMAVRIESMKERKKHRAY